MILYDIMRNALVLLATVGTTRMMTDGSNRLNYYYIILDDDLDRPLDRSISIGGGCASSSAENRAEEENQRSAHLNYFKRMTAEIL